MTFFLKILYLVAFDLIIPLDIVWSSFETLANFRLVF